MTPKILIFSIACLAALHSAFSQSGSVSISTNSSETKNVHEKIFAHTDKEFYLAGEIIWFRLYYVEATNHTPLAMSKVAYVEVVDKDLKPVLQGKIELSGGAGSGSFYLPASLNSGIYRVRAYTQWMKNFNAEYFFEKSITIINSLRPLEIQSSPESTYEAGFFPEGGDLVENIESRLAFKICDRFGKGIDYSGYVLSQDNDTITEFRPVKFGIGSILFTPKAGSVYRAMVNLADTVLTIELPKAKERGYVMTVTNEDNGRVRVSVKTNEAAARAVTLLIHSRQAVKFSAEGFVSNGAAEFAIDRKTFSEGVSQITVLNDLKKPVAERLFFVQPTSGLMISEQVGSRDYAPRSKVAVQLSSKDEQGKSTTTGLSVAVYKLDAMNGLEPADISSYLWLTSDLKGTVESPKYYLTEKGKDVEAAADNLMLTHGWRRFIWTDRSDSGKPGWSFLPEFTSHIIYARIINTRTEQPAPNMLAYLSVPGKRIQLYSSKSDSAGNLKFYTTDFYGSNEIMLQTEEQGDTSYRFEIVNPFSEKQSGNKFPAFSIAAGMQQSLTDYNVGVQVQNTFWGEKIRQLFSPAVDSTGFFGPPDNSYFLDDYVRFSTMEEVLREYVVEVLVRRQKETFRLIMSGGLENRVFLDDPLTLFNGVPVFDPNKIMQYDPLKIHKIEVVRRRYFYGPAIMNGIVNFVSFQPDPTMLSGLRAVVFDYEGVQLERQFYSPKYETPEQFASRAPDFRNVLYWSPGITTSADGKAEFSFYTSDQKGGFAVVVQGLNAEGKAGVKVFPINVK